MSNGTLVVGYPVHVLATYRRWTNPNGARFTDWTAACDARGTRSGHGAFGYANQALRGELCPTCFPGRHRANALPVQAREVTT